MTEIFDKYQSKVNESAFGFLGYWWPLFLDYNEAREADDPSERNDTNKAAVTLVFREFSYTEDRPGLNGETTGLVRFYMPLSKAIKHVLTDCRLMWATNGFDGVQHIPFEDDAVEEWEGYYRAQFFNTNGEPYLRPAHPMLQNVPPLPGIGSVNTNSGSGGDTYVGRIIDDAGGVLRPAFSLKTTSWARDAGLVDDDPKYNYTFLIQNTRFGRTWPAGLEGFSIRMSWEDIHKGVEDSDPRHGETSFIGYGNNVVGNVWSDVGGGGNEVMWFAIGLEPPQKFDIDELQRLAAQHDLWRILMNNDLGAEMWNWADYYAIEMFWRIGDIRNEWGEGPLGGELVHVDAGEEPQPQQHREKSMASFKGCPVPDYIIEGNTMYDWMQWASAMAGGWPDIGQRNRGDMVGERAHWIRSDIGPDTVVQWRGKNWRVAGDDDEARMDNVRWITSPPTDSVPVIRESGRGSPRWNHHPCTLASGVGWETLKRWRRLIPPPADGNENPGGAHFGYNTIDYGILLADNPALVPGYPYYGQNTELKPIDRSWEGFPGFPARLGGPIPDELKDPHGDGDRGGLDFEDGWNPTPEQLEAAQNAPWWRKAGEYRDFINEQNPEIFFEKFARLPVWEEVCAPEISGSQRYQTNPSAWPDSPLEVFDKNDPEEQWKIDQTRRAKRQIAIPPLFYKTYWSAGDDRRVELRKFKKWVTELGEDREYTFDVCIAFNKSIRPGLAPGPTDGNNWDYRNPGGNLAGIQWGKPELREIVPTTWTQNEQGARVANPQLAVNYPPWEGTPPWYLALVNYSQLWAAMYPPDEPWVANPPLWLMPAPPSYAEELRSRQDFSWPNWNPMGINVGIGIPGAIASQAFLELLARGGMPGIPLPGPGFGTPIRITSTSPLIGLDPGD